jgi:hypothetical protein
LLTPKKLAFTSSNTAGLDRTAAKAAWLWGSFAEPKKHRTM